MKIRIVILPENSQLVCDRCKSSHWPRVQLDIDNDNGKGHNQEPVTVTFCVRCLAYMIEVPTGWRVVPLVEKWKTISPLFSDFTDTVLSASGIRSPKSKRSKRRSN